ncbi:MAG: Mg2+/Co2+ transporter [Deltaproteobacteria bacterium RIFOXYD12_FULL_57_12]|nr:MAG: Mg2+/Co2+ transporter [Deltaproteobacteria bacterium RIFOXYD12_FULL_57_12]
MLKIIRQLFTGHTPKLGGLEILKYVGPGFVVTIGFIDPGNWAANVAAGSQFGYSLLWVVTVSTLILILVQHNAAHLGIVTGLCLSEAISRFLGKKAKIVFLGSAMLASISTSLAELLGAAIGLNMLFGMPLSIGTLLTAVSIIAVVLSNGYRVIERYLIGFVSLIGLSFIYEIFLADVNWQATANGLFVPAFPQGSIIIIMAVLGAVIMPHNIFLHSEIIQSREWHLGDEESIRKHLRYEYIDTILAMIAGWTINSAMIIVAAAVFFVHGITVTELPQAEATLRPLLGNNAARVFALALLMAGFSSAVSSALAGGSIFAGWFGEPLDVHDNHSRLGVLISVSVAALLILLLTDPFQGLIWSQVALSIQLPWTLLALIMLTSSAKVMGEHRNKGVEKAVLWGIALFITGLNAILLFSLLQGT